MKFRPWFITAALLTASPLAVAQSDISMDDAWIGGGLNLNSHSGWDDASGYQFFGGLGLSGLLNVNPAFGLGIEAGYWNSGEFEDDRSSGLAGTDTWEAAGLWTTAVATWSFTPEFYALGRAGVDFGDDDGLMIGGGAGFRLTEHLEARAELVIRDNIDSLQANALYRFGN